VNCVDEEFVALPLVYNVLSLGLPTIPNFSEQSRIRMLCPHRLDLGKFPSECNSERILKIGQYLVKLWTRV